MLLTIVESLLRGRREEGYSVFAEGHDVSDEPRDDHGRWTRHKGVSKIHADYQAAKEAFKTERASAYQAAKRDHDAMVKVADKLADTALQASNNIAATESEDEPTNDFYDAYIEIDEFHQEYDEGGTRREKADFFTELKAKVQAAQDALSKVKPGTGDETDPAKGGDRLSADEIAENRKALADADAAADKALKALHEATRHARDAVKIRSHKFAEESVWQTFAESDWVRDPGPHSQNRWRHVRTGRVEYSKTNPGAGRRGGQTPDTQSPAGINQPGIIPQPGTPQGQQGQDVNAVPNGQENERNNSGTNSSARQSPRVRKTREEREQIYQTARQQVAHILAGERTPEAAAKLLDHLSELTVRQLHDIKREYNLKASGRKTELREKIANRMAGATVPADQVRREPAAEPQPWAGKGEPEHGKVYNAPTDSLEVDPGRFQFKLNTDKQGVTQEMKSVKTWNPDFAGVISVWKDPADGKTYVVNGHHRRELAGRLGVKDMAVRYLNAKTHEEARGMGALINLAEGRGTAIDAAKYMREAKVGPNELEKVGVSIKGKLAEDALTLTHLNDRIFDRVARGTFDPEKAKAIGKHLENPELQNKLVALLDKREEDGKDISTKTVEEMAREMASTPTHTVQSSDLFGDIESEESLFVPRNELKSHIRAALSREVSDFQAVASKRRAERVGKEGNVLDTEKNKRIAEESEQVRGVFDKLVNSKGQISDAVNAAAKEYAEAKGKKAKDAARAKAVDAVRDAVFKEAGIGPAGKQQAGKPKQPAAGIVPGLSGTGSGSGQAGDGAPPAAADDGRGGVAGGNGLTPEQTAYADKVRKTIGSGQDIVDAPDSLGIPRAEMPQIPGPHHQEFMDSLKAKGINITQTSVPAASLKASQKELNPKQIAAIPPEKRNLPVVISNDGYLLDGHHRWAAQLHADPNAMTNAIKVDMPIRDLIKEANGFDKVWHKPADHVGPPPGVADSRQAAPAKPMTKEEAKAAVASLPAPDKLPEGHSQYFNVDKADKTVPMSALKNLRERPDGVENAGKFMEASRRGMMPKRDPIKVVDNGDGTYTVADGNSTFANAKKSGWKDLPVKIVSQDFLDHEQEKTLEKEHGRARQKLSSQTHFTPEELSLPKSGMKQADNTKESLYAKANATKPVFDEILDKGAGVQKALGAEAISPKSDEEFNAAMNKPGPVVLMAPLKGEKRATEKVQSDYKGDWSNLTDLVRGTVAVDTAADIPNALKAIKEHLASKGWTLARSPKNRFDRPTMEGYSDMLLNAKSPDGHISEIQVHVKPMVKAKQDAHKLYEQQRSIAAKISGEKRKATPEEISQIQDLIDQQRDVYGKAYLSMLGLHSGDGPVNEKQLAKLKKMWDNNYGEEWEKDLQDMIDKSPQKGKSDVRQGDANPELLRVQQQAGTGNGPGGLSGSSPAGRAVGEGVRPGQVPAERLPADQSGVREGAGSGNEVAPKITTARPITKAGVAHLKKQIASGKAGVKTAAEPFKSDLTGDMIRRYVQLPTGARVHPDELHRIQHGDDGEHYASHENITVSDPISNMRPEVTPTFERALHSATMMRDKRYDDDRVRLQGPHGYSAEKTRAEWRKIHDAIKAKPESWASWYDRENPESTSEAAANAPARPKKPDTEQEVKDFFAPKEEQGKLFDYKTKAAGDIFALPGEGKNATTFAEWDESKHPRADDGRFGEKPGEHGGGGEGGNDDSGRPTSRYPSLRLTPRQRQMVSAMEPMRDVPPPGSIKMDDEVSDVKTDRHTVFVASSRSAEAREAIGEHLSEMLRVMPEQSSLSEAKYYPTPNGRQIRVASHDEVYHFEDSGINVLPGHAGSTLDIPVRSWIDPKAVAERAIRESAKLNPLDVQGFRDRLAHRELLLDRLEEKEKYVAKHRDSLSKAKLDELKREYKELRGKSSGALRKEYLIYEILNLRFDRDNPKPERRAGVYN